MTKTPRTVSEAAHELPRQQDPEYHRVIEPSAPEPVFPSLLSRLKRPAPATQTGGEYDEAI